MNMNQAPDHAGIDMPYNLSVQPFHDQAEAGEGDRSSQREGWPAATVGVLESKRRSVARTARQRHGPQRGRCPLCSVTSLDAAERLDRGRCRCCSNRPWRFDGWRHAGLQRPPAQSARLAQRLKVTRIAAQHTGGVRALLRRGAVVQCGDLHTALRAKSVLAGPLRSVG